MQPQWKIVWRLLKKLKIELTYDPEIPLLSISLEKMKTLIWKDIVTLMFIAALFKIANTWKQFKCPSTYDWFKMWYIYPYIYFIHYFIQWNITQPFAATWMELEIITLSEVSQRQISWYRLYVESKKMIQMNLFTKKK